MYRLSHDVTLPKNAATSTYAFLGTRGTGKSYAAGVLVEEFLDAGVQVVVVDPVGSWYGLRLSTNGKSKGYDVPVFGGLHGDVPLEPTGGALVASLIVNHRMSCVLDISDFTEGEQRRFATDLCREVFNLKKRNKSPLHMVFEEGHEFFPQFVDAAQAPMAGATKRLWKIGRNYGIGGTIVSQRAAEVNKGALNLSDKIFTGKLKAPEDIKRIDGWANANGASDDMIKLLPDLPKGTMIAWEESGAVRTVFRKKRTFDASATPDGSDTQSHKLAPIDLDEVRTAMAATIEEAKASDPKTLRARVAELERELTKKPAAVAAPAKEVAAVKPAELARIEKIVESLAKSENAFSAAMVKVIESWADRLAPTQQKLSVQLNELLTAVRRTAPQPVPLNQHNGVFDPGKIRNTPNMNGMLAKANSAPARRPEVEGTLPQYARELLAVVAQRGSASASQISTLSGYRRSSSAFPRNIARLAQDGLIEGTPARYTITTAGRELAGTTAPLPTGRALLDHWMCTLQPQEAGMLSAIYDNAIHGANALSREKLSAMTGYSQTSSSFGRTIKSLRDLELIGDDGETLNLSEVFLEQ
jgi:hypothetical protein